MRNHTIFEFECSVDREIEEEERKKMKKCQVHTSARNQCTRKFKKQFKRNQFNIKKRNNHSSVIAEKIHTRNTAREIKKRMHCQERKKSKINELKKQQKTFETN